MVNVNVKDKGPPDTLDNTDPPVVYDGSKSMLRAEITVPPVLGMMVQLIKDSVRTIVEADVQDRDEAALGFPYTMRR